MSNKQMQKIKQKISDLERLACVCGDSKCYKEHSHLEIEKYKALRSFNNNTANYWIIQEKKEEISMGIIQHEDLPKGQGLLLHRSLEIERGTSLRKIKEIMLQLMPLKEYERIRKECYESLNTNKKVTLNEFLYDLYNTP